MDSPGVKQQKKTLEVKIERLLPGGVGLAHADGLTIFVSLAAPGDILRVEIDRTRGKVAFASIKEILKPSPVRIEPPCPYFGRCGGCDFQQLDYQTQLKAKVEIIQDCLRRIAQIQAPPEIQIHPSPSDWQYRARANWQFDPITSRLGYFERGSNLVCDVEYCAVLAPELQQTLERVRNRIHTETASPRLRSIEAVAGSEGVSVVAGDTVLAGFNAAVVTRRIGNETYYFSAEGFFQTNHDLLEQLIDAAIGPNRHKHEGDSTAEEAAAESVKGGVAIDLYCGVGLFTLPLARQFEFVVGIESNPAATEFARRNLESAELKNADIITARVGDWLTENSRSVGPVDFLLLDPPRTGAENRDIAGILAVRPRAVSYVSCDPATLARDLKKLMAGGYTIDSVTAFDMFPQTHHVETVVRLSKNSQAKPEPGP